MAASDPAGALQVCLGCRRLVAPRAPTRYRTSAAGHELVARTCPHCERSQLASLADPEVQLALESMDRTDRLARSGPLQRLAHRGIVAAATGAAITILFVLIYALFVGGGWGRVVQPAMAVLVVILFGGPLSALALRGMVRQWKRARPQELPARWVLALPPANDEGEVRSGPLERRGDPIVAPLSGRPCLAFEVGVRRDERPDAPPGTWLLLEQRNAPLAVADREVPADTAFLNLPRQLAPPPTAPDLQTRRQSFLQSRGLAWAADHACIYETILGESETVELRDHGERGVQLRAP